MVRSSEQGLEVLDTVIAGHQFTLRDGHLLLKCAVLLNELLLHHVKRVEVVFQELELALLSAGIGRTSNNFILLLDFVELQLEFNNLLAAVLEIFEQALADDFELRKLYLMGFAIPLELFSSIGELFVIRAGGGGSEGSLESVWNFTTRPFHYDSR